MSTKYYDMTMDKGYYTKVSAAFIRDSRYTTHAKAAYVNLLDYALRYEQVYPSQQRLCGELRISEKTLRLALKELVDAGLLTITRRGQGKTNIYKLHLIPLINNYGDNPYPKSNNSRSRTAQTPLYSVHQIKQHGKKAIKGPIDYSKYTEGGKYGKLTAENRT